MQVVFTVNGPGEISGWLYPLARALKARHPEIRIVACILPCVFSTGAEADVLRRLGPVDAVCDIRTSFAMILRGRLPAGVSRDQPTLVFHLGGEIALSVLLGWRLRAPLYAYAERGFPLMPLFKKVFFNGLNPLSPRLAGEPTRFVGELMVDAARLRRAQADTASDRGPRIALFPGSRDYMAGFMLPYFAVTAEALARSHPEVEWLIARADFVSPAFLRDFPALPPDRCWPALPLTHGQDADAEWLATPAGVRLRIVDGRDALALADLALTIPGTNTGELAAAGVPMVVALPTYMGHEVPLPGLPGHLGRLPLVGPMLKRVFGKAFLRKVPLLSQPNRRAGRMIVPEFVGEGLHPRIEAALAGYLDGETADLRAEIRDAMGQPGAAVALADHIAAALGAQSTPGNSRLP